MAFVGMDIFDYASLQQPLADAPILFGLSYRDIETFHVSLTPDLI